MTATRPATTAVPISPRRRPAPVGAFVEPGRMLSEPIGKLHFWLPFIGFHLTFAVHHLLGARGMPRRYADYQEADGFTWLNTLSTIGAFVLGISMLPFLWNVVKSYRYGAVAGVDDPWGHGNSLEWVTTCPPPRHNFHDLPPVRSERPAFDLHHPEAAEQWRREWPAGTGGVR